MTAAAEQIVITEPGVYDIPDAAYHADPIPGGSLSVSGAKRLLPPHCPARYKYELDNGGRPPKADFDFGHAAHHMLLGVGPSIKLIDAGDWRTKKAREERDEAYAAGDVPMLVHEFEPIQGMVQALREHPIASKLFENGKAEQSLFWRDEPTGVWLRGRLDFLPNKRPGKRMVIPDYKTATSANGGKFAKSAADYGYAMQKAMYVDGVIALGIDPDPAFVNVVQEKVPPYLVNVIELDVNALRIGRGLNRRAIDIFAECQRTNRWPGYSDGVELVSLPTWFEREHEDLLV